jgi:ATP-dependent helicase/nuclease subunit A
MVSREQQRSSALPPPDQDQRDLILSELYRNMLVEAAAGTGKTTSMVARMIALLRTGACTSVRTMAAVTFTRKAAAGLRSRFQVRLEEAVRKAEGEDQRRLEQALAHVEQCYIGTIHSFCARLLRERPVEANVDLAFEEMEEDEDTQIREEAWAEYTARRLTEVTGDLAELDELGLRLGDLKASFLRFADFPDVDRWPADDLPLPDLRAAVSEVRSYVAHIEALVPRLPDDWGNDALIPILRRVPRVVSHYDDLRDPVQLMELLGDHFDKSGKIVQKEWTKTESLTREDAKAESARWEDFRARVVQPTLRAWREYRYPRILRILTEAREVYDEVRHMHGRLSYQDLLMRAADLLRDKPHVRRYFRERFTHLLVDEFQDTDPIQAEVMLLLTATDPEETNWRECQPHPGALFVVGDPKQSIYRFRRADIVTYNEVKQIISREGGLVVQLSANFRSSLPIVEWVNGIFSPDQEAASTSTGMMRFPESASEESPSYVPLNHARDEGNVGQLSGLYMLHVPAAYSRQEMIVEYDADRIARSIRHALDAGATIPRSKAELERGAPAEVNAGDFMIIARNMARLSVYAHKLQEYGIPHQVAGGAALNQVPELKLLHLCLVAVTQPDNPVALVAALRGELFGLSDRALYGYKKAGGRFSYRSNVPDALDRGHAVLFDDAFSRLRRYWLWLAQLPPVPAFARIVANLGLMARAAARPGGDVSAGSLAKALEILRGAQADTWTTAQLVEYLGRLVAEEERHDGISAGWHDEPAVRVMNLHKVKGLEAPVVFLADPYGESDHPVSLHIDRSGDEVLGYLAIHGEPRGFKQELLALPPDWEELAAREKRFGDAEALRLRYVAATRAGAAMIVTETEKGKRTNPWGYFASHLTSAPELPDPSSQTAPARTEIGVTPDDVEVARAEIAARVEKTLTPAYGTVAAKAYALSLPKEDSEEAPAVARGDSADLLPGTGEYGLEWGAVIHLLLQRAMRDAGADLDGLARSALVQHDLDPTLAGSAVATVQAIMGSDLWQRALRSPHRLVEVPFQVLLDDGSVSVPTIVRGAIDLIFKEPDGWVLVDVKTDKLPGGKADSLVEKYSPQVRLYADAWCSCVGEKVKETVLYFTQAGLGIVLR